jgi:flagellar protein FliS
MFDSVLVGLDTAREGFGVENLARRNEAVHNSLMKVQQVVAVLQAALDLGVEGDLPRQMYALYDFILAEVQKANVQKAWEPLEPVRGMVQDLRDAWAEMLNQNMAAG